MKRKSHFQFALACMLFFTIAMQAQQITLNPEVLIGHWKLDMTPENSKDTNFAQMKIQSVSKTSFNGSFYSENVVLKKGMINMQLGIIYGALVSEDNSGTYNTSFYYKEGKLYGSTHSLGREFLAVWTATKTKE